MKTENQFLAECDEKQDLIALVLSESYPQIMINHIADYVSNLGTIQFSLTESAIRINEVTAQYESGYWINLEDCGKCFYFEDYIGIEGDITKLRLEFEKLTKKYAEQKNKLVATDYHDAIFYDLKGYKETFAEALEDKDVEWLEDLVGNLKLQTKAFDTVIKVLKEISFTFC
jgi:hypothetical protein